MALVRLFVFLLLPFGTLDLPAATQLVAFTVQPGSGTLEKALAQRQKYSGPALVKLGAGEYRFNRSVILPPHTHLSGEPGKTILRATPAANDQPCGLVVSSHCQLQNFTLLYERGRNRQQSSATAMVHVVGARDVTIRGLIVSGSASVGILLEAARQVTIRDCNVSGTLADGIHITNGSSDVLVHGCYVHHTGDDAIATVSYRFKAAQSRRITIRNNRVEHGLGRALTCIGSADVIIADNRADDCIGGIYVAYESFYSTYAPENVSVERNLVTRCGKRTGMQGLHVGSAHNVTFTNNTFRECLPGYVSNTGAGPNRSLLFQGNRFEKTIENGHSALEFLDTEELELRDNRFTQGHRPSLFFAPDVHAKTEAGTKLIAPSKPWHWPRRSYRHRMK